MSLKAGWYIFPIFGAIMVGLVWLFTSTHGEFRERCESVGGVVDGKAKGFWCVKDGVYIKVD